MSNSQSLETGSTSRGLRSSTTRNPRRRQRQSEGDSLKTAAPRRKRSKLSEVVFAPHGSDGAEHSPPEMNGSTNGSRSLRDVTPATNTDLDLPVRGRKGAVKRTSKGDGAKSLTQNKTYNVKLLPSTPRELARTGVEYRGSLGAGHHALAVSREKAYIWDYTAHTPVSHATEFAVPFATRAEEPLPFGALVTSPASVDIGLVLISATSGKTVFYESIDRAASMGLFRASQTGVEGLLGPLHNGEIVVDLVPSEHVGFIVLLSSGRIFQLSLRDTQGRPRITSQYLRATERSTAGIFGSIKGFLGSMLHKGIIAVQTRALDTRGQVQVVALSEKAYLQVWNLEWSGNYEFRANVDFRELIVTELKTLESPELQGNVDSTVVLDFVIAEQSTVRGDEVATLSTHQPLDIWIILRVGTAESGKYVLAELSVIGEDVSVKRLQELETYTKNATVKPKLLLPRPGHTGFVAFENAMVLFATTDVDIDGPEAQLHASYQDLRPFEDTVYFRADRNVRVSDATNEDTKTGQASCIAFVQGAGLVRFAAIDPAGDIERTRISAKDRLAQAVFYGGKDDNIIDFSKHGNLTYPIEEIEAAALDLSNEIVRSEPPTLAQLPISMDEHLATRSRYLHTLVTYVVQNYTTISRRTLWQLLCNAEKIAAGRALWKLFEEHKSSSGKIKRTATVMDELCARAQQRYSWAIFDNATGDELVHRMFASGLHRLEDLLPLVRPILEELREDRSETPEKIVRIVNEADDIWNRAMYAAFDFRLDHGHSYGLAPELLYDGVMNDHASYVNLPEFWTSTEPMLKSIIKIAQLSREFALEFFNKEDALLSDGIEGRIAKISSDNPKLVELICRMYRERIFWQGSLPSARDRDTAEKLKTNFDDVRYDEFRELMALGQSEAAMGLAEKYHDMHTLTELVVMDSQYFLEHQLMVQLPEEQSVVTQHLNDLINRTGRYFEKFGDDWANAFFDSAFSGTRAGLMLEDAQNKWEGALTKYLRAQPSRARICWINDVMAKKDFEHAAQELIIAGREQETKLWAKKVELSMSKLALLAAQEDDSSGTATIAEHIGIPTRELTIVDTQEQLYRHIYHEIIHCIDHEAAVSVALDKFVPTNPEPLPNLRRLLEAGLERVLEHRVLALGDLVDVLTLIQTVIYPDEDIREGNLQGSEFYLALVVLNAAAPDLSQRQFEAMLKLIWKRCFLHDNWITINSNTSAKGFTDDDVQDLLRKTAAWRTFYHLYGNAPLESTSILQPSQCFGAGCQEEDLADRFPEELLRPIVQDNQVQDEMLQNLVTDRRLDEWIAKCESDARRLVHEEAEARALLLEKGRVEQQDKDKAQVTNGHIDKIKEEVVDGAMSFA